MSEYGVVTEAGTVRIERVMPGPIERVWAYLTESDKRGLWLAPGAMELKAGGKVELNFKHADLSSEKIPPARYKALEAGHTLSGRVTQCVPPRLLAYTWGEGEGKGWGEVTFELAAEGANVRLILTHRRLPDRAGMVSVAGGWHAHTDILIDRLHGREPRGFWSNHTKLSAEYERRIAADGVS